MDLDLLAEFLVLALAVWAAVRSLPRSLALDAELLFKVAVATGVRGELEAAGGDRAAWSKAVLGTVLWNPAAGARPEEHLRAPDPARLGQPARSGERALVEALARLPGEVQRFRTMYVEHPAVEQVLLSPPAEVLPEGALAFGPGLDWEAVAGWTPALTAALARRASHLILVELGGSWGRACADALPGVRLRVEASPTLPEGVGWEQEVEAAGRALGRSLLDAAEAPADRYVMFAENDAVYPLIAALEQEPLLRDRTAAVVRVGRGAAQRRPDWLAAHFTHEGLDPELQRCVPWFTLAAITGPPEVADPGWAETLADWGSARLPDPPVPESGRRSVEVIDLGPLVIDGLSEAVVARSLWVVLAWRLWGATGA